MIELEVMAQWVTCQRGRVASALVTSEGIITVPARNGTPYGSPTCAEIGADPKEKCPYCVHSEKNVINHAARLGVVTLGQRLYTLCRPCINCAHDIVQAGIKNVYYRWSYESDNAYGGLGYVISLFDKAGIIFGRLEMSPEEETFHKMITEWRATWTKTP